MLRAAPDFQGGMTVPWDLAVWRIKDEVVATLADVSDVYAVATFGSLADGRADAWSDLDLFVACDHVARTGWVAASAIRIAKPVIYYRPFSGVPQPSGRYWFEDELPFHRLDVSFHPPASFRTICRNSVYEEHRVVVRQEYVRSGSTCPLSRQPSGAADTQPLGIAQAELDAGATLYHYLEAVKARRRGQTGKYDRRDTRAALLEQLVAQPVMVGGDFERLARRALDL